MDGVLTGIPQELVEGHFLSFLRSWRYRLEGERRGDERDGGDLRMMAVLCGGEPVWVRVVCEARRAQKSYKFCHLAFGRLRLSHALQPARSDDLSLAFNSHDPPRGPRFVLIFPACIQQLPSQTTTLSKPPSPRSSSSQSSLLSQNSR